MKVKFLVHSIVVGSVQFSSVLFQSWHLKLKYSNCIELE